MQKLQFFDRLLHITEGLFMISETKGKIKSKNLDRYRNLVFEAMSQEEKNKIRLSIGESEKSTMLTSLRIAIKNLNQKYDMFEQSFNIIALCDMSLYDRYHIFGSYHHCLLQQSSLNKINGVQANKLFSFSQYKKFYNLNLEIIELLSDILHYIIAISRSKMGHIDINEPKEIKILAMKNTFAKINNYLTDNTTITKLKNTNYIEKILENILCEEDVLDVLTKNHLNFISSKDLEYKMFEQIILAPIKISIYKYTNKTSTKKDEENYETIIKYLKNSGLWNEEEKNNLNNIKLHKNEFHKIPQNNIIHYCVTVFSEFFGLNFHDLRRIYAYFYTDTITTNTNFLKSPYKHINTTIDNDYIEIKEFLPYMPDDFKDIFYEID